MIGEKNFIFIILTSFILTPLFGLITQEDFAQLYANISLKIAVAGVEFLGWKNGKDFTVYHDTERGIQKKNLHYKWVLNSQNRDKAISFIVTRMKSLMEIPDQEYAKLYADISVMIAEMGRKKLGWIDGADTSIGNGDVGRGVSDWYAHYSWGENKNNQELAVIFIQNRLLQIFSSIEEKQEKSQENLEEIKKLLNPKEIKLSKYYDYDNSWRSTYEIKTNIGIDRGKLLVTIHAKVSTYEEMDYSITDTLSVDLKSLDRKTMSIKHGVDQSLNKYTRYRGSSYKSPNELWEISISTVNQEKLAFWNRKYNSHDSKDNTTDLWIFYPNKESALKASDALHKLIGQMQANTFDETQVEALKARPSASVTKPSEDFVMAVHYYKASDLYYDAYVKYREALLNGTWDRQSGRQYYLDKMRESYLQSVVQIHEYQKFSGGISFQIDPSSDSQTSEPANIKPSEKKVPERKPGTAGKAD